MGQRPRVLGRIILDDRFGRQYRLLKTDDFPSVSTLGNRCSHDLLQVSQSDDNGLGHPRFSLVVDRKAAKRVNVRNYMECVIRDWLHHHKEILLPHNLAVRVHQPFMRENTADTYEQSAQLMKKR